MAVETSVRCYDRQMAIRRISSLNWLRVFEAAAQAQSFKSAADALNMTRSAVSQQIAALEQSLGKQLFVRKAKGVELTEEGLLFLPIVRGSLSAIEVNAARLFGPDDAEQLTIEAPSAVLLGWLNPILPEFLNRHPEIGLRVKSSDYNYSVGQPDSDVVVFHAQSIVPGREVVPILPEYFRPVAHPSIARKTSKPRHLMDHRLIDGEGQRAAWKLVFDELGLDAPAWSDRPNATGSDTTQTLSLAASGIGIALARSPVSDRLVEALGLEACLPDIRIKSPAQYFMALRPADARRSIETEFGAWLLSQTAGAEA